MKSKKTRGILSASVLIGICMLTGCAGNAATSVQNETLLSVIPASDNGTTVKDLSTVEIPAVWTIPYMRYMGCLLMKRPGVILTMGI